MTAPEANITRFLKLPPYVLVVCCLVVVGGLALTTHKVIAQQLDSWQLLPRPERLTELYFNDYRQLPVSFKNGSTATIAFTVHNLEHQTTTYRYKIITVTAEHTTEQQLATGTFVLEHDRNQRITQPVTVPPLAGRAGIKIVLEYSGIPFGDSQVRPQTQSIHYWAPKS